MVYGVTFETQRLQCEYRRAIIHGLHREGETLFEGSLKSSAPQEARLHPVLNLIAIAHADFHQDHYGPRSRMSVRLDERGTPSVYRPSDNHWYYKHYHKELTLAALVRQISNAHNNGLIVAKVLEPPTVVQFFELTDRYRRPIESLENGTALAERIRRSWKEM